MGTNGKWAGSVSWVGESLADSWPTASPNGVCGMDTWLPQDPPLLEVLYSSQVMDRVHSGQRRESPVILRSELEFAYCTHAHFYSVR